jgi:phosphomannomutase
VQAIFDAIGGAEGKTFVLGGDGRYFNDAPPGHPAHGRRQRRRPVMVGQGGILSTPAASCLIRKYQADGGIILSASHNPGGPDEDFGIKFNIAAGGPAPEGVTDAIHARTETIDRYRIIDADRVDLDRPASSLGGMHRQVVDPVGLRRADGALFDFNAIHQLFNSGGFRMRFDAMHAVTGPYAVEILENRLGAEPGTVMNGTPLPDFGGGHPDPNLVWASPRPGGADPRRRRADFGAASDGDGDRNMILGRDFFVTPSDSLAVLAANAHLAPGYKAASPGSPAPCPPARPPTAWPRPWASSATRRPPAGSSSATCWMPASVTLCGEESFGTGSDHVREKDGLWAVLFWLNLLAAVLDKLDYLTDLGVSYVHFMPCLKPRPGDSDGGYSVMDYRAINPAYGTMDEFEAVAAALRARGISLCVDLVLNHTAREHDWAVRARKGEARYRDYYLIYDDRKMPAAYEEYLVEVFPDNAPGNFTFDEEMGKWVWTTFNTHQWDLNWANPWVFLEMVEVMLYLANRGVDVLRFDAVAFMWKRLGTRCQSEPEVHMMLHALRAASRIAAPAVIHLEEAIVGPEEMIPYLGQGITRGARAISPITTA